MNSKNLFELRLFAILGQCSVLLIVRSSTLLMLGYDVTRGIPAGAFLLAVHPDTNLPKADLLESVAPRVASICNGISCRLISLLHSVSSLLSFVHE